MPSLSLLVPLRHRGYRRVWTGQLLSAAGDGIFQVALIFDVLRARGPGRRSELGFVLAADSVGLLVVVLLGGVLADRMPRNRLMIIASLLQAGAVVGLALAAASAPSAVLAGLAFVVGLGIGLFYPAYQALLPSFLEGELRQAGNALQSLATSFAGVIGPALGGLVVIIAGSPRLGFLLDAASFVICAMLLLGVSQPVRPVDDDAEPAGVLSQAVAGLRAVWQRRWMTVVIAQGTLQVLLVVAPEVVLLPLVLRARGQLGAYGFLLGVQALGSVAGGVLASRLHPRRPGIVAMAALMGLTVELVFFAVRVPVALLGAGVLLTGAGYAIFGVLWSTAMQHAVPEKLWSRVFSVESVGTFALYPVGTAATAPAVAAFSLPVVAAFAAVMLALTTIVALPVPGVRELADPPPAHDEDLS